MAPSWRHRRNEWRRRCHLSDLWFVSVGQHHSDRKVQPRGVSPQRSLARCSLTAPRYVHPLALPTRAVAEVAVGGDSDAADGLAALPAGDEGFGPAGLTLDREAGGGSKIGLGDRPLPAVPKLGDPAGIVHGGVRGEPFARDVVALPGRGRPGRRRGVRYPLSPGNFSR